MLNRRTLLQTVAIPAAAALPGWSYAQEAKAKLSVVASFSILADLVRQVGGERVDVTSFVGPDGDAHVYQPSAADAKRLAGAKLVVVNGLGFEGWIDRLVKASGTKAPLAVASRGVNPLKLRRMLTTWQHEKCGPIGPAGRSPRMAGRREREDLCGQYQGCPRGR